MLTWVLTILVVLSLSWGVDKKGCTNRGGPFLALAAGLQSVAVRQSTGNDVVATISAVIFFSIFHFFPPFFFHFLRPDLFS